jgi:hypothetical protein
MGADRPPAFILVESSAHVRHGRRLVPKTNNASIESTPRRGGHVLRENGGQDIDGLAISNTPEARIVCMTPISEVDRAHLAEMTDRPPETALCPAHAKAARRVED